MWLRLLRKISSAGCRRPALLPIRQMVGGVPLASAALDQPELLQLRRHALNHTPDLGLTQGLFGEADCVLVFCHSARQNQPRIGA